jgi:hypothetical protein
MREITLFPAVGLCILAISAPLGAQPQLPDVFGIRPGISAQEAYDLLKKRAPRAKIGVGQFPVAGLGDKPVSTSISVNIPNTDPPEVITIWLTLPPSKQVVWAIGRKLEWDEGKQVLKSNVIAGLQQKYGPETDPQNHYWAFDEQGQKSANGDLRRENCAGRADWSLQVGAPEGATYPSVTPLIYGTHPQTTCNSLVEIKAQLDNGTGPEYVKRVTVILSDLPLARRSQDAYQAYLANGDAAKRKEDLERAKQQKTPIF